MSSHESGSSSDLPLLNRHFKPHRDVHSAASAAITSDDMPFTPDHPLSTRPRRQNDAATSLTEVASVLRPSCTEDLESAAVTSDDMSIANETPLTTRPHRQNKSIPIAQAAALLRPFQTEDLDKSVAVPSDDEFPVRAGNAQQFSTHCRRHDQQHFVAPAADLFREPSRGRRQGRERPRGSSRARAPAVPPHAPVPVPVSAAPAPASIPALAPAPCEGPLDYGYGYAGFCRGNFFLTEDVDVLDQGYDPLRLAPRTTYMFFNNISRPVEVEVVNRQNAELAEYEHSLDLFPGVEVDRDSGSDAKVVEQREEMNEDGKVVIER
ncbi:hypothetical protein N7520_000832 [Penicillium odoratum]|uniref:uncharacterized protein n=1 Tax=Penicillium odoratum TaxID=1167516 RepID=UPI002546E9C9|nr:uncharacterized protein N7520_000832 [Penicillium odoratum]KAJ5777586.1 hypothetical protein N7520_000832 [Penicillium odoratum]